MVARLQPESVLTGVHRHGDQAIGVNEPRDTIYKPDLNLNDCSVLQFKPATYALIRLRTLNRSNRQQTQDITKVARPLQRRRVDF